MQDRHSGAKQLNRKQRRGFTIVELLIVVVVIAILAAITIVSYNGITASAKEATLKSDLSTAAKKLNVEKIESGSFPSSTPGYIGGSLSYSGGGSAFCVSGEANGTSFRVTESGSVEAGECALPVATTMQTFTAAHCAAQPMFTGANPTAVINLTDSRGGTTRTYEVAKLADNKCWMLTNLKLGSTSGVITLTPADSNVANNFTLPQVGTSGSSSNDNPHAYGPVPGDTGSGATNYGYLYNWPAATAGASTTSHPAGSGNTTHSICPVNWRLPTAGVWHEGEFDLTLTTQGDFSGLDIAFGGNGSYANGGPSLSSWQPSGPFRGVFSGRGTFSNQGSGMNLWSSSEYPYSSSSAHSVYFDTNAVSPGATDSNRLYAYGVRCLLN